MKREIEGSFHGEMDEVYDTIRHLEKVENTMIDLHGSSCGDFQKDILRDLHIVRVIFGPLYHIGDYVMKLKDIKERIDVFISHDWPVDVYEYGNSKRLVQCKPHFKEEDFLWRMADAWNKLSDDGKYTEVGDVDELEELAEDENEDG